MKLGNLRSLPILCIAIGICAYAHASPTHEEQIIRTTYAKFAYATQECVLLQAALTDGALLESPNRLKQQMDSDVPVFEITDVAAGTLTSIADVQWSNLVTPPKGELVNVTPTSLDYAGKGMKCISVVWNQGEKAFENNWNIPVNEVIAETPTPKGTTYTRYASYTVRLTLRQHVRSYKALFLFGTDSGGREAVFPIDHLLGMGSLNLVMEHSFYPELLLETSMRDLPGIREWIASAGIECSRPVSERDVCCDAVVGKCGLPNTELSKSRAVRPRANDHYVPPRSNTKGDRQ